MSKSWISAEDDVFLAEQGESFKYGMVRLVSWPNLSRAPETVQVPVARVCALLSRKPSAGRLIPLILSEPEQQTFRVMATLVRLGHISLTASALSLGAGESTLADGMEAPAIPEPMEAALTAPPAAPARRSLIGKLWAKLVS